MLLLQVVQVVQVVVQEGPDQATSHLLGRARTARRLVPVPVQVQVQAPIQSSNIHPLVGKCPQLEEAEVEVEHPQVRVKEEEEEEEQW